MLDKLNQILINLNEHKSKEFLSLIYFLNDDHIPTLDDYIKKQNIKKIYYKNYIFDQNRSEISINEKVIINTLQEKYMKYYIIIYNFYIENSDSPFYLEFLESLKNKLDQKLLNNKLTNRIISEDNIVTNIKEIENNIVAGKDNNMDKKNIGKDLKD